MFDEDSREIKGLMFGMTKGFIAMDWILKILQNINNYIKNHKLIIKINPGLKC